MPGPAVATDPRSTIRAVAIMGATATGKSALAMAMAREFNGEIISMDSRQVYRGLDIGTAKVDLAARAEIPHHLIDILDPTEPGSAGTHARLAEAAVRDIAARGRVPILAGGTGFYYRALFRGMLTLSIPREASRVIRASFAGRETTELHAELTQLDAARARELSPNDRVRVMRALELVRWSGRPASELYASDSTRGTPAADIVYLKLVLTLPRAELRERIAERTRALFQSGWPEEVARLKESGLPDDAPALTSLGYKEIAAAHRSGQGAAECLNRVIIATRQYGKRQETFFRSESDALWIDITEPDAGTRIQRLVAAFLRRSDPQ